MRLFFLVHITAQLKKWIAIDRITRDLNNKLIVTIMITINLFQKSGVDTEITGIFVQCMKQCII